MRKQDPTCMICGGVSRRFFAKTFSSLGLSSVEYFRCIDCGFVHSETHALMSDEEWGLLNESYHLSYQNLEHNPDDPRWLARIDAQARFIADCADIGLIPQDRPWLDYAAGGGQLSYAVGRTSDYRLFNFDRFMPCPEPTLRDLPARKEFDFVISTSVFEHLRNRRDLDEVDSLVSDSGVMGLHTLVREHVPNDPDWFYLLPVHCAFFSNKSMATLFQQWGYQSSMYDVESRLWLFFKRPYEEILPIVDSANKRPGRATLLFQKGFLDYWK
jgi:hypothetical protein